MKRFHGLARARGYGLRSVSLQAKFTALAVNLKRIAKLVSSSNDKKYQEIQLFLIKLKYKLFKNFNRNSGCERTT